MWRERENGESHLKLSATDMLNNQISAHQLRREKHTDYTDPSVVRALIVM